MFWMSCVGSRSTTLHMARYASAGLSRARSRVPLTLFLLHQLKQILLTKTVDATELTVVKVSKTSPLG